MRFVHNIPLMLVMVTHVIPYEDFKNCTNAQWSNWLNWITEYIAKDLSPHQILVTIGYDNNEDGSGVFRDFINHIQENHPTFSVNMIDIIKNGILWSTLHEVSFLKVPRATTLFLCLHYPLDTLSDSITIYNKFWSNFTENTIRPRILFVSFYSGLIGNYEQILKQFWTLGYLDCSILVINILDYHQTKLHHFNPFTTVYTQSSYSAKMTPFPDKLQDLDGYTLKVGVEMNNILQPLRILPSGCPQLTGGMLGNIIEELSTRMNFSMYMLKCRQDIRKRKKITSPCIVKQDSIEDALMEGAIDLVGFPYAQTFMTRQTSLIEISNIVLSLNFAVVIPQLKIENIKLSANFSVFAIVSAVVVGLLVATCRIFRFESSIWNMLDICNVLMGTGLARIPEKFSEKVMLGAILIISLSMWVDFLYEMTEFTIHRTETINIDTLEELSKSKLIPVGDASLWVFVGPVENPIVEKLMKRTKLMPINQSLQQFVLYRNVTFVVLSTEAELLSTAVIDVNAEFIATRLSDCFQPLWQVYHLKSNSPYVERINKELQFFVEFGLIKYWDQYKTPEFLDAFENVAKFINDNPDKNDQSLLIYQLLFIAVTGYSIAILAFIFEIFSRRFGKQIDHFRKSLELLFFYFSATFRGMHYTQEEAVPNVTRAQKVGGTGAILWK